jgi:hypothetical protein
VLFSALLIGAKSVSLRSASARFCASCAVRSASLACSCAFHIGAILSLSALSASSSFFLGIRFSLPVGYGDEKGLESLLAMIADFC